MAVYQGRRDASLRKYTMVESAYSKVSVTPALCTWWNSTTSDVQYLGNVIFDVSLEESQKDSHLLTSNTAILTIFLHFRSGSLIGYPESRKWSSQCSSSMAGLYTLHALGLYFYFFTIQ